MDELLTSLGIDKDSDLNSILEALEEKQFEYLERLETVSDENRKAELTEVLRCMDEAIATVKEQIKSVSSSVILDTPEPVTEVVTETVGAVEEKKKEEPVVVPEKDKSRVESTDKKSEEVQSVPKKYTVASPSVPTKEVSGDSISFLNGLVEYKKQNYEECFKIVKESGEKEDSSSQYLLALMYLDGLGVTKDVERSAFWMRKSAQAGEVAAQFMYGAMQIEKSGGDRKKLKEGFRFLSMAAEQGDADAMRKFVNETLKHPENKNRIKTAIDYCDELKRMTDDSFNKKEMEDKKRKLREKKKMNGPKKLKIVRWIFLLILLAGVGLGVMYKEEIKEFFEEYRKETEPVAELPQDESVEEKEPEEPTEIEEVEVVEEKKVRMIAMNGNIRSGASTNYESLTKRPQGTELIWTGKEELEPNGGGIWYEVKLEDGTIGWVHESIIEFIE